MPSEVSAIQKILKKFQRTPKDTGSSEVQVALLTSRIKKLTPHFETHVKDNHSRRGLQMLVDKRRKLLKYLKNTDLPRHEKLIKDLETL